MSNQKTHWIPCALTMSNLFLGVLALLFVFDGKNTLAAVAILSAACLDRADGQVARKFNASSDFGKELDSLCDLVSFGVAPAILVWAMGLNELSTIGILLTAVFPLSGAYRLARFNVNEFVGAFQGMPITIAGGLLSLAALANAKYQYNLWVYPIIILILSFLMVSKIRIQKI